MEEDTYGLGPDSATKSPANASRTSAASARPVLGIGVQGNLLQLRDSAALPERCIFCNGTSSLKRVRKRLTWMENDAQTAAGGLLPYVGIIFKIIWLIRLVGRFNDRQQINIEYSVCATHRTIKLLSLLAVWVLLPLSAFLFVMGFVWQSDAAKIVAGVLFFLTIIAGVAGSQGLSVTEVGRNGFLVSGAGKAFMATLKAQNTVRVSRHR